MAPNIVSVTAKHENTEKILEKADLKRKQDERGARGWNGKLWICSVVVVTVKLCSNCWCRPENWMQWRQLLTARFIRTAVPGAERQGEREKDRNWEMVASWEISRFQNQRARDSWSETGLRGVSLSGEISALQSQETPAMSSMFEIAAVLQYWERRGLPLLQCARTQPTAAY